MKFKRALPYAALGIGGMIGLTGVACIGMYIFGAIISRIGEPDQSLLFWYLPILFIGILGLLMGLGLGVWGAYRLKNIRQQSSASNN